MTCTGQDAALPGPNQLYRGPFKFMCQLHLNPCYSPTRLVAEFSCFGSAVGAEAVIDLINDRFLFLVSNNVAKILKKLGYL